MFIDQPAVAGMFPDLPRWQVPVNGTTVATDLVAPDGVARQRKGWTYENQVNADYHSVWRAQFALAGSTHTIVSIDAGAATSVRVFTSSGSTSPTSVESFTDVTAIPRAMYRDQVVICFQDGVTPIALYSGAAQTQSVSSFTATPTASTARYTLGSAQTTAAGSYLQTFASGTASEEGPGIHMRVTAVTSTTSVTAEGVKPTVGTARTSLFSGTGITYPCVPIYSESTGTLANAGNTFTGTGTRFSAAGVVDGENGDALLVLPSGASARCYQINTLNSDTSLTVINATDLSNTNYQILRRCPFKDVAVHNESLYGTGVSQYPNRVYISPAGWNPAIPPGFVEPFDTDTLATSDDASEFRLFEVDVPGPYDGDHNVALLEVDNGVLVIKRDSVHVIRGTYPNFAQQKVADGAGCIDIRSAQSLNSGPFWAGYDGVFTYQQGQVINLMEGRISDEWRALVDDGVSTVATGESEEHLLVSVITSGGTYRVYVFDLANKTWISRFSNMRAKAFWSGRDVPDNPPKCLWVGATAAGASTFVGVANAQPMFVTSGDERDGDLTEPALSFTTGTGLTRAPLDQETRLIDISFTTNLQDSGAAGTTVLTPSVTYGGGLRDSTSDTTVTLSNIESDTVDRVDRTQRWVRRSGREFSVTITANGSSTTQKVEVHQIALTFRDVGRGRR